MAFWPLGGDAAKLLIGSFCVPVFVIQQEAGVGTHRICTTELNSMRVQYKIMKIPQYFLSPVFSTSQWQLPFQKENHSGSLATRIVSVTITILSNYKARPCLKSKVLKKLKNE